MPTNNVVSPYATAFINAVKRGVPCFVAVNMIANKKGKTPKTVFESLCKAGLCCRQKIGSKFVYFPFTTVKTNTTSAKNCQVNMWQCFVDWCITSGVCTPRQLRACCGTPNTFMNNCKKFFNRQTSGTMPTTVRTFTMGTTTNGRSLGRTTFNTRKTHTRRYRRAA